MLESCYVSPHILLGWGGRFQKLKIYMLEYTKDVDLHTCISGVGQPWEKLTMRMWFSVQSACAACTACWVLSPAPRKPTATAHTCDPSAQKLRGRRTRSSRFKTLAVYQFQCHPEWDPTWDSVLVPIHIGKHNNNRMRTARLLSSLSVFLDTQNLACYFLD